MSMFTRRTAKVRTALMTAKFPHAMVQLHTAAARPGVHSLRRRVAALLGDAGPSHLAIVVVFSAELGDILAAAPLAIQRDLLTVITDSLELACRRSKRVTRADRTKSGH